MPFTVEQFLGVFAAYNAAIWPLQAVAYGLGLLAVAMVPQLQRCPAFPRIGAWQGQGRGGQ